MRFRFVLAAAAALMLGVAGCGDKTDGDPVDNGPPEGKSGSLPPSMPGMPPGGGVPAVRPDGPPVPGGPIAPGGPITPPGAGGGAVPPGGAQ